MDVLQYIKIFTIFTIFNQKTSKFGSWVLGLVLEWLGIHHQIQAFKNFLETSYFPKILSLKCSATCEANRAFAFW